MHPLARGALLAVVCMVLFLPGVCLSGGPITHMTVVDDVIKHPDLDEEIRKILREYLEYAKGGAVVPDLGNLDFWWNSTNSSHYCSPGDLARSILGLRCEEAGGCFLPISALS